MIDLTKISHIKLTSDINGKLAKYWVMNNGEKYLFKDNYRRISPSTNTPNNSQTNWGEMLYSKVCKKLNVPCVSTAFAIGEINGECTEGVLVKSYLTQEIVDALHYDYVIESCFQHTPIHGYYGDVESCLKFSRIFAKTNKLSVNFEQVRKQLTEQAIIDYFFGQVDRHYRNIEFLVTKNNELKLAPIFDNGHCFAFYYGMEEISDYKEELMKGKSNNQIIGDKGLFFLEPVEELNYFDNKNTKKLIKDVYKNYISDDSTRCLVDKILALDIVEEINQLEASGGKLKNEYKECAQLIFEGRKNLFMQCQKKIGKKKQSMLYQYCIEPEREMS